MAVCVIRGLSGPNAFAIPKNVSEIKNDARLDDCFLGVGFVIGTLVMLSCINDYVKRGLMERRGRVYRIIDITDTLKETGDDRPE